MSVNGEMAWCRLYGEAVDDEKLRLLDFGDRWQFIALLCCKTQGVLNQDDPLMMRKVAVKLGLQVAELESVARRLAEVGLIDEKTLEPVAWDRRQFRSDSSKERVKAYRERMKRYGNVTVTRDVTVTATPQETETETEKERESVSQTVTEAATKLSRKREPLLKHPTPEEVSAYCRDHNYHVDGQRFCDYYQANGWRVGKVAMKDWQAAVRTWERNEGTRMPPRTEQPSYAKTKPLGA